MESQRYTNVSLYSQKGGKKISFSEPSKKSYSPDEDSLSLVKLFKQNRLLQQKIEKLENELQKEKHKNSSLTKQIKSFSL